jgi:hypothetical protein
VPSSARSTSSTAAPLPAQLAALLAEPLAQLQDVIGRALPVGKKRSALEEALWEQDDEGGALDRELMLQCESRGGGGVAVWALT